MDEHLKKEILHVLIPAYKALKKKNLFELRALSDNLGHSSSIFQDKHSISVAILIYSLFKIMGKNENRTDKNWDKFYKKIGLYFYNAIVKLKKDDLSGFENYIKKSMRIMREFDKNLSVFIQHVIQDSKIKKGSNLYAHGLSSGRVAELLGISQWELMSYIGIKKGHYYRPAVPVVERVKFAKKIFGVK